MARSLTRWAGGRSTCQVSDQAADWLFKAAGEQRLAPAGLFLEVLFGYVTALAPSYEVFAASRLLVGLMNGGISVVCFVLAQEYVGRSYWAMTGMTPGAWDLPQGGLLAC